LEKQAPHIVYLHLGSNIGERKIHLEKAIQLIAQQIGNIIQVSDIYETEAWGKTDQRSFLNQAIKITSHLYPLDLLKGLQEIEKSMGRKRKEHWGARTIDLDMIFYDYYYYQSENLTIPHPRMHLRNFVLIPMMDLQADFIHPVFRQTVRELYGWCQDDLECLKYS
jgi:2-amino-4-hydroxy-6-hydroxymethyldihydropteridine diphosphokinase